MSETDPPANQPTNQPTNQPATQPPAESGPRLVNGLTPEQRAERHRDADALCWRSVRCHLGAVALVIIVWLNSEFNLHQESLGYQIFQYTCLVIALALYLAAWVFMLKARVNYRESTFTGVLLGIYIAVAAFVLTTVIVSSALNLLLYTLFPGCGPIPG